MSVLPPPLCSSLSPRWCCKVDSAGQSACFDSGFTLRVSGLFGLEQIQVHSFILQMQCEGLAGQEQAADPPYPQTFFMCVILDAQGLSFSGVTSQIRVPT